MVTGLTPKSLKTSRNKLIQAGVIFFDKRGNRGTPSYSFNALFGQPDPFTGTLTSNPTGHLHAPQDGKQPVKGSVNGSVNGQSYQVEGKSQEREKGARPPDSIEDAFNAFLDSHPREAANDLQALADRINGLSPIWKKHPHLTGMEMQDLAHPMTAKAFMALEDRDWNLLRDYLRAVIPEEWAADKFWQPNQRSQFIRAIGDIIQKAEIWARKAKWKPAA